MRLRRTPARAPADGSPLAPAADDHELVEQAREREASSLAVRERATTAGLAGAFVAVAAALAIWMPQQTAPRPALVLTLVLAYALAARVQFEVGFGSAVPTQL